MHLGVILHYEDVTLRELYFLDPQWLCDVLAHVITIREINPFARNGLMKIDDLQVLFKSLKLGSSAINLRCWLARKVLLNPAPLSYFEDYLTTGRLP